jgi:predicted lipoprotein with Yx(FWY)xxD motif
MEAKARTTRKMTIEATTTVRTKVKEVLAAQCGTTLFCYIKMEDGLPLDLDGISVELSMFSDGFN